MRILTCFLLLVALVMVSFAADITGKWTGTYTMVGGSGDSGETVMVVKQNGTEITGTAGPGEDQQWPIQKGKIEGNKITGEVSSPDGAVYKLDLVVDGDRIRGEATTSQDGQTITLKVDLTRAK